VVNEVHEEKGSAGSAHLLAFAVKVTLLRTKVFRDRRPRDSGSIWKRNWSKFQENLNICNCKGGEGKWVFFELELEIECQVLQMVQCSMVDDIAEEFSCSGIENS